MLLASAEFFHEMPAKPPGNPLPPRRQIAVAVPLPGGRSLTIPTLLWPLIYPGLPGILSPMVWIAAPAIHLVGCVLLLAKAGAEDPPPESCGVDVFPNDEVGQEAEST